MDFILPLLNHDIFTILEYAVVFLLYAEIHYRFKIIPSRLYQRQPEIIADIPHRLEPGHALPVLILMKDAQRFPVELYKISVKIIPKIKSNEYGEIKIRLFDSCESIRAPLWWRVFPIELSNDWFGIFEVDVEIHYRTNRRFYLCHNDNYSGTSHKPLEVFIAKSSLPQLPGFYHGDVHCHTDATSDQVEFGAPVEAMALLAKAQGIHFFAAADHSYDLDDMPDNYLKNDPTLQKWFCLQERIRLLNKKKSDIIIIPGEEVSCGNANQKNVHLLVLNNPDFIHGYGDSGERWLRTKPTLTIPEVLDTLDEQALAFAAHPAVPIPKLESILLGRGMWQLQDLQYRRLHGVQFWNGRAQGEDDGLEQWRRLLLQGGKVFTVAGSDAHGNFSRYRQISFPLVSITENDNHLFGYSRTAVKLTEKLSLASLMRALKKGSACISTGALVDLVIKISSDEFVHIGETTAAKQGQIVLHAVSTEEFGKLEEVILWFGCLETKCETILFKNTKFLQPYDFTKIIPLPNRENNYYLRAEVYCDSPPIRFPQTRKSMALTNPIWCIY